MEKRHFEIIAKILRNNFNWYDEYKKDEMIDVFIRELAKTNPRFNAKTFREVAEDQL